MFLWDIYVYMTKSELKKIIKECIVEDIKLNESYNKFIKSMNTYPFKDDMDIKKWLSKEEYCKRYKYKLNESKETSIENDKKLLNTAKILFADLKKTMEEEFGI